MALIKFELKENHIKLLKHLKWSIDPNTKGIISYAENGTPYGGLSLTEDVGLILYGNLIEDFDPLSAYGPQYTEEQKEEMASLYEDLPLAMEVILFLGTFECGHYKTKWNTTNWIKYIPKN
jgi:hypothetical protein